MSRILHSQAHHELERNGGAMLVAQALTSNELVGLAELFENNTKGKVGFRAFGSKCGHLVGAGHTLFRIASEVLGVKARPVRVIFFDKSINNNWGVGWHQDRVIAVRDRIDVEGFCNWSIKEGVNHVEPPFSILKNMITLRAYLDDCGPRNGPLEYCPNSHELGKLETNEIPEKVSDLGKVTSLAKSGDVWVYASTILHASKPSELSGRRRVLHVEYSPEDLPGGLCWFGV